MSTKREASGMRRLLLGMLCGLTPLSGVARADPPPGRVVVVQDSIQAAVDAASPGDTVFVPPGVYRESVLIDKSPLTLIGPRSAILDASGFENGIRVGSAEIARDRYDVPACPAPSLADVSVVGLTVRNAEENGLFMIGVDGFKIVGGRYLDNGEYGPFPICSRNGLIAHNEAEGHHDAAIYVGDDDRVLVTKNVARRNAIGIEIENSTRAVVRHNWVQGNTTGILVVVLPGLPFPFTRDVWVERNWVVDNNLPNPVPLDSGDPVGLLPSGTGILNVGGDGVIARRNWVLNNGSVGIALIPTLLGTLDPRVDPFPDGNRVVRNVVLGNGRRPDLQRLTTPPADLVYVPDLVDPETGEVLAEDPDPDNCFAANRFRSEFPDGVSALFACR